MGNKIEKEKNIILMGIYFSKENIIKEKNGQVKDIGNMKIMNLK